MATFGVMPLAWIDAAAYGAKFDGVTDDTASINSAVSAAYTLGVPLVMLPSGTALVSMSAHPTNGSTNAAIVLRSGVTLSGSGQRLTTIKLKNSGGLLTSSTQNRIITNYDMSGGTDKNFSVYNLTVDGNAANNGSSTSANHGIQPWRVNGVSLENVTVKNCRGNDTASWETFGIDVVRCTNVNIRHCTVTSDDGGSTATGFSANFSDRVSFINCHGNNMTTGHGFTVYSCRTVLYSDCRAFLNGFSGTTGQGFNLEHSWDVTYDGCQGGGVAAYLTDNSTPTVFTPGTSYGNHDSGFHVLLTLGGGNVSFVNCISSGNVRGIAVLGSTSFTTTTGTTGSTIVGPSSTFTPAHIGRWIQVNGGTWVRITGWTSDTTVTTSAAHGGATTQTANIMSGNVTWQGSVGSINGNTSGVQFLDSTTALKQLSVRATSITPQCFRANTNDLVDVGNGSGTSQSVASGIAGSTLTDSWASGTEYYNPFPCSMTAIVVGGSASTSLRGGNPSSSSTSTATNSGAFPVEPGGAVTATATSLKWLFRS